MYFPSTRVGFRASSLLLATTSVRLAAFVRNFFSPTKAADERREDNEETYWQRTEESASRFNYLPRRKVAFLSLYVSSPFFSSSSFLFLSVRTRQTGNGLFRTVHLYREDSKVNELAARKDSILESTTWANIDVVMFKEELLSDVSIAVNSLFHSFDFFSFFSFQF